MQPNKSLLERLIELRNTVGGTQAFKIGEHEWLLISKKEFSDALDELIEERNSNPVEDQPE